MQRRGVAVSRAGVPFVNAVAGKPVVQKAFALYGDAGDRFVIPRVALSAVHINGKRLALVGNGTYRNTDLAYIHIRVPRIFPHADVAALYRGLRDLRDHALFGKHAEVHGKFAAHRVGKGKALAFHGLPRLHALD